MTVVDVAGHVDLERVYTREAEVVGVDEEGTVEARIVPYEQETELEPGLWEVFTRGAFAAAVGNPSRCKVTDQGHQRTVVVGHAIELRDLEDGHYGRLRIADTSHGRDLLALFRAGSLDQLSVEFRILKRGYSVTARPEGGRLLRHNKAQLLGVSPVSQGAYADGARVLAVRETARASEVERVLAHLGSLRAGPKQG